MRLSPILHTHFPSPTFSEAAPVKTAISVAVPIKSSEGKTTTVHTESKETDNAVTQPGVTASLLTQPTLASTMQLDVADTSTAVISTQGPMAARADKVAYEAIQERRFSRYSKKFLQLNLCK